MILAYNQKFEVFPCLFIVLKGRHIRPAYLKTPLDLLPLDHPDIKKYTGCELDFQLYFRCTERDFWHTCFNSRQEQSFNDSRLQLLEEIDSLIVAARSDERALYEPALRKLKAHEIRVTSPQQLRLRFAIKLQHRCGKPFDGLFFTVEASSLREQLQIWTTLADRRICMELGLSCLPKKGERFFCNFLSASAGAICQLYPAFKEPLQSAAA